MNSTLRHWLPVFAAVGHAFSAGIAEAQNRPFSAEDMLSVVQISGAVDMTRDGDRLAFVLPDLTEEWNVGERLQLGSVHLLEIGGFDVGEPVPVGGAGLRSSHPAFSPDGADLALYVEDGGAYQLAIWNLRAESLTRVGLPFFGRPSVSPQWASSNRVVYERAAPPDRDSPTDRVWVMESTDPVLPGDGVFRTQRRAGASVVDLDTGLERNLVADGSLLRQLQLSPDGDRVLVVVAGAGSSVIGLDDTTSARPLQGGGWSWTPAGELVSRGQDALMVLDLDSEPAPRAVRFGSWSSISSPTWSPDGGTVAGLGPDPSLSDPEVEMPQPDMYTIARPFMDLYVGDPTTGMARNVTAEITDQVRSPAWSPDGRALYFVATDNDTYDETVYRYDPGSDRLSVVASGSESYGGLMTVDGGVILSIQSAVTPGDLWRINARSGDRTRLTYLNRQLRNVAFSQPELFHFESEDGDQLGALLYRPIGEVPPEGIPVVAYLYEKLTPGIHRFQPRQQIFATHGYAVLMPNVKVKVGETGTSFVRSVVPALRAVQDLDFANDRACLWGGSFGAYATSFVITQTDVFDCAVSRATPPELFRNWASGRDRDSDNIESGQARMGGSPFQVMERYLSQSAFFHLDQVETPVLITHGMKDSTILFDEGAMMFYALRRLGKQATFVAYREGDHSLYRHSRADALDVHQRMLDWFGQHLR